jgi:hypothetical protein
MELSESTPKLVDYFLIVQTARGNRNRPSTMPPQSCKATIPFLYRKKVPTSCDAT